MTSANTVQYSIKDKSGKEVHNYRQNILCKSKHWENISKFVPYEDYTIQSYGLDEEEEEWYGKVYNLRDFIGYLRVTRQTK